MELIWNFVATLFYGKGGRISLKAVATRENSLCIRHFCFFNSSFKSWSRKTGKTHWLTTDTDTTMPARCYYDTYIGLLFYFSWSKSLQERAFLRTTILKRGESRGRVVEVEEGGLIETIPLVKGDESILVSQCYWCPGKRGKRERGKKEKSCVLSFADKSRERGGGARSRRRPRHPLHILGKAATWEAELEGGVGGRERRGGLKRSK